MRSKSQVRLTVLLLGAFWGPALPVDAEGAVGTGLSVLAPVAGSWSLFQPGPGGLLAAETVLDPHWSAGGSFSAAMTPTKGTSSILWAVGSGSAQFRLPLSEEWALLAGAEAGYFGAALADGSNGAFGPALGGGLGLAWRPAPGLEGRIRVNYFHAWKLYDGLVLSGSWWVGDRE